MILQEQPISEYFACNSNQTPMYKFDSYNRRYSPAPKNYSSYFVWIIVLLTLLIFLSVGVITMQIIGSYGKSANPKGIHNVHGNELKLRHQERNLTPDIPFLKVEKLQYLQERIQSIEDSKIMIKPLLTVKTQNLSAEDLSWVITDTTKNIANRTGSATQHSNGPSSSTSEPEVVTTKLPHIFNTNVLTDKPIEELHGTSTKNSLTFLTTENLTVEYDSDAENENGKITLDRQEYASTTTYSTIEDISVNGQNIVTNSNDVSLLPSTNDVTLSTVTSNNQTVNTLHYVSSSISTNTETVSTTAEAETFTNAETETITNAEIEISTTTEAETFTNAETETITKAETEAFTNAETEAFTNAETSTNEIDTFSYTGTEAHSTVEGRKLLAKNSTFSMLDEIYLQM